FRGVLVVAGQPVGVPCRYAEARVSPEHGEHGHELVAFGLGAADFAEGRAVSVGELSDDLAAELFDMRGSECPLAWQRLTALRSPQVEREVIARRSIRPLSMS